MSLPPPSTATRAALDAGLADYRAGRFWHAHEAWEEAWLREEGDAKLLLQALIQLTAACHKGLVLRHARGMATLFAHALEKLETIAARHGADAWGLDLAAVIAAGATARRCAEAWAAGGPAPTADVVPTLEA